jgi:hypothetical protein
MKNRPNTPNLEKCAGLLAIVLEFAKRGGFEANTTPSARSGISPKCQKSRTAFRGEKIKAAA